HRPVADPDGRRGGHHPRPARLRRLHRRLAHRVDPGSGRRRRRGQPGLPRSRAGRGGYVVSTALVLDASGKPPAELLAVLAGECETVEIMTPDTVLSTLDNWLKSVEILLASATIPAGTVKLVNETLVSMGATPS